MKKKIIFDRRARRELENLSQRVQAEFQALFLILSAEGKLDFPESRKIDRNLFELRVRNKGQYRGLYGYLKGDLIIILHFFKKKTQKTPLKNLKTAKRRLKPYE